MDVKRTVREIGLFEMGINLEKVKNSEEICNKVGDSIPLPAENMIGRVKDAAKWILSFDKHKYLFFQPEIALFEEMKKIAPHNMEIIILLPCDLNIEEKERIKSNLPSGVAITNVEEPFFPESFYPGNGIMVISGYLGGNRLMVLADTYRMVEHYSGFLGKKVFVPYVELDTASRYDGWIEMNPQRISADWRREP